MHSYKSPEGVWYMFFGHIQGASFRINPDGSYDEEAKAKADDFNNGGHSVSIDGIEFKMEKNEKNHKDKKTSNPWLRIWGYKKGGKIK